MNIQDLLLKEAEAIRTIPQMNNYFQAVDMIHYKVHLNRGRLITCGIGKAGQVAHNLATTFASTGTPAYFLHPTEAKHGDLGILTTDDVLLLISNSGETVELLEFMELAFAFHGEVPVVLITGNPSGSLSQFANPILSTGNPEEVCPLGLTPTTSTTVMSVIGDILVCMMMEKIGFTAEEYYTRHHGGYLGKKVKERIGEKTETTVMDEARARSLWLEEQLFRNRAIDNNPRNDANGEILQ